MATIHRKDRFCVIGEYAHGRTWRGSIPDAVKHAQDLMSGHASCKELFVVEVKRVVRRRSDTDVFVVSD